MKQCTKCKQSYDLSEFTKNSGKCRGCKRAHDNERYANDPARKAQVRAAAKVSKEKKKQAVYDYLRTHPCVDCGEGDPVVLQFDHRDNVEKVGNISTMTSRGMQGIWEEISKCDVRCANCHLRRTAIQFNWYYWLSPASLVQ